MTFKCHSRSSNVVPIENRKLIYELLIMVRSIVTFAVLLTILQAVLMLKTTFFLPLLYLTLNLVMLLECADEIWRQKTRTMGLPYMKKS